MFNYFHIAPFNVAQFDVALFQYCTICSGGFRDCGARSRKHLRGPCLKIFVD